MRTTPAALLLALFVALSASAGGTEEAQRAKAPDFEPVKTTHGKTLSKNSFAGKTTALFFFSIYSGESAKLLEYLEELYREAPAGSRLEVVGVNIDPTDDEVKTFLQETAVSYPIALDTQLQIAGRFRVRKVPTVFLVGEDATIRSTLEGFGDADGKALLRRIKELAGTEGDAAGAPAAGDARRAGTEGKITKKTLVAAESKTILFSPGDPNLLMYITPDGTLWVYDVKKGRREAAASGVETAGWNPGGDTIVFSTKGKSGMWTKSLGAREAVRITPYGHSPAWSPDGGFIAFNVHSSEVWVYDVNAKRHWRTPVDGERIEWSSDGGLLLVTDAKGRSWLVPPRAKMPLLKAIRK
ncbi:MAG: redoxin domain-containing protein [bacterium]